MANNSKISVSNGPGRISTNSLKYSLGIKVRGPNFTKPNTAMLTKSATERMNPKTIMIYFLSIPYANLPYFITITS